MAEAEQLEQMVDEFPARYRKAAADWLKFQAGVDRSLFSESQVATITAWYEKFPDLWELVRPNWEYRLQPAVGAAIPGEYETGSGELWPMPSLIPDKDWAFVSQVDQFVDKLKTELRYRYLGIAPLIVVGVVILAAATLGGAIWALGYLEEQQNISKMIEQVTAGKLDPAVLEQATAVQRGTLEPLSDFAKYGLIGLALYLSWPMISKAVRK